MVDAYQVQISPLQQMLSSCCGATITSLLVTPLDVVKTRMQAQQRANPPGNSLKYPPMNVAGRCYLFCNGLMDHMCLCNAPKSPYKAMIHNFPAIRFNSTLDAFSKITHYEGVTSLWSGLSPTLVMAVPATVLYFTCYDQIKEFLGHRQGSKNVLIPGTAGVIARTIATTAISPIELLRTKLQSRSNYTYPELITVVRNAVRNSGVLSLWQGCAPTLFRDVPFSALYWVGYEQIRAQFHEPNWQVSFLAGAVSGMIAAVLTIPFDVVKTHRQMELGEMDFEPKVKLSSTFALMMRLYREKGLPSLFAGVTARVVKVAPACAIMISTYEGGKQFFRERNRRTFQSTTTT